MKKYTWLFGIVAIALLLWGGSWLSLRLGEQGSSGENPILAKKGLHWHSKISIAVRGQNVPVPANIGLGAVHNPIHTHDDPGVIHMEFDGAVRQNDTRLQKFFEAWNKQLSATCLLDECGGTVTMRVNGVPNTELGDYIMKNKDTIEISYEQKM
mgnify:FL=1